MNSPSSQKKKKEDETKDYWIGESDEPELCVTRDINVFVCLFYSSSSSSGDGWDAGRRLQRKTDKVKTSNKKHKHSDGSYSDSSSSFIRQVSDLSSSFTASLLLSSQRGPSFFIFHKADAPKKK